MPEDIIRDRLALSDPLHLVEAPVDAQVDAALAVLLHRLAEAPEGARTQGPDGAIRVAIDAVELVGGDGERDPVSAVEPPQRLEQGRAEGGMPRGVGGERRGEAGAEVR